MQTDSMKRERQSNNWLIWLLSISACILLILIVYQDKKIKNSQNSLMEPSTIAKADTGQIEPIAVSQQQADYEKTIQQLQAQLKDLQNASNQDPGAARASAIPPPDGSSGGGPGGDSGIIDMTYKPLLNRLGLSSEENEKFVKFLTKRRQAWIEIEDEIINLSLSEDDRKATIKELEESAWEYDKQALELLGYENYQKYNEYNSSLGVFINDPVDEFKKKLRTEEEINTFQEEQLVAAMAEEFEDFMASTVPEAKGPPGFRIGMRDEQITSKIAAGLDDLQERYLKRASTILTESQIKIFENYIESKITDRKLFFE